MAERDIKSATRVFEVLEHFAAVQRPLSLRDIVAALRYPSSSTAALLKNMAAAGYLSFDPLSRRYLPTVRVAELGAWIGRVVREESLLDELVRNVQQQSQCTVVAYILNDLYVEHVEFLAADDFKVKVDPNVRIPALASPLGWVLLKDQDDLRLERTYRRSVANTAITRSALSLQAFLDLMKQVRGASMLLAEGWPSRPYSVVAATLPLTPLGRTLAIGVGAKTQRLTQQLREVVKIIEKQFSTYGATPARTRSDGRAALAHIVMPPALRVLTEEGTLASSVRSRART